MAISMLNSVGAAQAVDAGYADFLDGGSAKEVEALLESGKTSATGKVIFDYVDNLPGTIYVFPIRDDSGLGSQYLEPRMLGKGVVFFNLTMSKKGKVGGKAFSPVVQLYHELGHAKQYGEWGPNQWDSICQAGTKPVTDASTRLKTPYPMVLESDNMKRHEFPMCDEIGCVKRANYMDLKFD